MATTPIKFLLVRLAAPAEDASNKRRRLDGEGNATQATEAATADQAPTTAAQQAPVQYKLTLEAINAHPGSLLASLLDMGDGAGGLAMQVEDDGTAVVQVPPRDPQLFKFAMEVYRLGSTPALRAVLPSNCSPADVAAELGYWQLSCVDPLQDPLLWLSSGPSAGLKQVKAAVVERLWQQMLAGISSNVGGTVDKLLAHHRARWAFLMAKDKEVTVGPKALMIECKGLDAELSNAGYGRECELQKAWHPVATVVDCKKLASSRCEPGKVADASCRQPLANVNAGALLQVGSGSIASAIKVLAEKAGFVMEGAVTVHYRQHPKAPLTYTVLVVSFS